MLFDDTQLEFRGRWGYHVDPRVPNQYHSFHETTHSGDTARLDFTGTAIQLYGFPGPQNGLFNVTLDNKTTTLNGSTGTSGAAHTKIFSRENLDPSTQHHLVVTNAEEGHHLSIDLVNVTSSSSTTTSGTPSKNHNKGLATGTLIAIIISSVLCGLFLFSLIFLLYHKRKQRRIEKENALRYVPTRSRLVQETSFSTIGRPSIWISSTPPPRSSLSHEYTVVPHQTGAAPQTDVVTAESTQGSQDHPSNEYGTSEVPFLGARSSDSISRPPPGGSPFFGGSQVALSPLRGHGMEGEGGGTATQEYRPSSENGETDGNERTPLARA